MKFGRIKRQHARVQGLDQILSRIIKHCPHVSRIVPGRIKVRRGKTPPSFKIQYPTEAGLKCLCTGTGTVQEVFIICTRPDAARQWLEEQGITPAASSTRPKAAGIFPSPFGRGHQTMASNLSP
ncbi:MAG TPA: DUF2103 domain-containing protein [Tepidisphaeraceae bacterium]|nr:DUF2103 domain-containing protein [Tepidisphaeraceae bacterium]